MTAAVAAEAVVLSERVEEGIEVLTINRPKALNALNADVLGALGAHLGRLAGDPSLRVLVITGGGRAFVAGADIAAMQGFEPSKAQAFAEFGHGLFDAIEGFPVPVIAAVNGFALGGGCELALACDLVYASEKARFGLPEVTLGLIPGFGGTQRLTRRIGGMRAAELVFTGRHIKPQEAFSLGLCLDVLPPDELMVRVLKVAQTIASRGPAAVRTAKAVMLAGRDASLPTANALERAAFAGLFASHDAKEGIAAFLGKREADFQNR
jgi:enoyl-CoA hydratase